MSTSRDGASCPVTTARRRISAPAPWPPTSGWRPHVSRQNSAMTSASQSSVYGWRGRSSESPCSGRSGQHEPEAVGEVLDERDELAVRQRGAVHEAQARPDARLAVGDPRAVAMVVEAQLHPLASPSARLAAQRAARGGASRSSSVAVCSMRRASCAARPGVCARAAPHGADEIAEAHGRRRVGRGRRAQVVGDRA